jgi:hypothetical protein
MHQLRPALALIALLALACSEGPAAPGAEAPEAVQEQRAGLAGPVRARAVGGSASGDVRVVGVMINGPTREQVGGEPQLAFVGSAARTRVALEVRLASGGIIDMDREASTLQLFRDDRGTDLLDTDSLGGPFELMPTPAGDGRSLVAIVAGDVVPAQGASRIDLRGTISLITASTEKTHRSAPVALVPGTELTVGPYSFEVTETGPADWGEGWSFTLETDDDLTPVISWSVVDARGASHEADPWMTMSFNSTTRQSLRCDAVEGPVRVELRAYDDARRVELPFQTQAGLGLR